MEISPIKGLGNLEVKQATNRPSLGKVIWELENSLSSFESSASKYLSGGSSLLEVSCSLKSAKLALELASEVRRQATMFVDKILNMHV
jgi:flagellar hook-basal body complex protein FliE